MEVKHPRNGLKLIPCYTIFPCVLQTLCPAIHKERDKLNASVARTQSILATEKAQLEKQIEMLKPEEKEVSTEVFMSLHSTFFF